MTARIRRQRRFLTGLAGAAVIVVAWASHAGLVADSRDDIFWQIRLPRVCLGFLTGAGLAVSGMAFQAMFRNALATPYTLGVSSAASLGAALYLRSALRFSIAGVPGVSAAALAGAGLSTALVYGLTRLGSGFSTATLLLAGVAVSFSFTSLILLTQYMSDVTTAFRVGRWLMGGLEVVGFEPVWHVLPFVGVGLMFICLLTREMDLLLVGEDLAAVRGLSVERIKKLLFFAVSIMVGGVTAVCGPIGFVGLIVPHIGRLLVGPHHRHLAPFSILGGGAFLVICDAIGREAIAPIEIPVGSITALIGGPFFLVLLLSGRAGRGFEL